MRVKSEPGQALHIREMTRADLAAARDLLEQLGYPLSLEEVERRYAAVIAAPDHRAVVAEAAGRVAGLLHVFARPALENPPEAVIEALVVDGGLRRSGIGRTLMAEAERWAAARGLRSVMLSSNVVRRGAHAFYHALGYGTAATSLILRKRL
jgi:GNAT superfamily N-acetyltransferase